MGSTITLRSARAADVDTLGRLGALLVREHYEFDSRRFLEPKPDTPGHYGRFLISRIDRREAVLLVAERSGQVVGYAFGALEGADYMSLRGPAGVLYDLIVDESHRRQGVGKMLLDGALEALRRLGAPRVILFTAERNSGAQAMFDRSGFRRTMIEMTRELD